jgi:hypothetical protein
MTSFHHNQSLVLKTRESARYNLADRADTRGDLLISLHEIQPDPIVGPGAIPARFSHQKASQPLAHFTQ